MACNEPEFLRITAHLRTPVVSDAWLPLDGILFYQATRAEMGPRMVTISGSPVSPQPKGERMLGGRLPIKIVHNKDWFYRCSWAVWGPTVEGTDYWNKRFDQSLADYIDFRGKRGRIDISSSTYRAYHFPVFYRSTLWIRWYCVGVAEEIRQLLRSATHLGKKTSQGWGRVAAWEIDQIEEDWSIWKGNELMRGVPIYNLPKDRQAVKKLFYGVRPPYWDTRNQIELEMP